MKNRIDNFDDNIRLALHLALTTSASKKTMASYKEETESVLQTIFEKVETEEDLEAAQKKMLNVLYYLVVQGMSAMLQHQKSNEHSDEDVDAEDAVDSTIDLALGDEMMEVSRSECRQSTERLIRHLWKKHGDDGLELASRVIYYVANEAMRRTTQQQFPQLLQTACKYKQ